MYNLPETTTINQQLPKKAIYEKFSFKAAERERFDADISRMALVARISTQTIPALAIGKEIEGFYVVDVQLKQKNYNEKSIILLTKLIPQRMVFALQYENEVRFAVFHARLQQSEWKSIDEADLPIEGLNLDTVWENIVSAIGSVQVQEGLTLEESMLEEERKESLLKKIESLERKLKKENQAHRKYELHKQIQKLKSEI